MDLRKGLEAWYAFHLPAGARSESALAVVRRFADEGVARYVQLKELFGVPLIPNQDAIPPVWRDMQGLFFLLLARKEHADDEQALMVVALQSKVWAQHVVTAAYSRALVKSNFGPDLEVADMNGLLHSQLYEVLMEFSERVATDPRLHRP